MERHLLLFCVLLSPWASNFCTASRIEDYLEEMAMQELLDLHHSLLQSNFIRRRSVDHWSQEDEKAFALEEVRKAWYIHEIKERLDLGDVKEDLLSQLTSLQQQCPDAEEIQSQLSDLWEEVGRWVKADNLRLAMEKEQTGIHSDEARMNLDIEGTKHKITELEAEKANATKVFNKDQESRLVEIVTVSQRLQELKKLVSSAVHSDDARELQEQYDSFQKAFKDLTKDMSDSQLQQAFHVVDLGKQIEAVKKNLSKEHIENELKSRTQMAQSRYNALKRQLEAAKKEIDVSEVEKQIMSVWDKSLHDLPDMAELLSCDELRQRVAKALDVFVFRVALAKGETPLEGAGSLASKGLTGGEFDVQVVRFRVFESDEKGSFGRRSARQAKEVQGQTFPKVWG